MDFDIFLAEMLPIEYAIKRRITMSRQITCASALLGKTENNENRISLKFCISALLEFNQLFDFFNLFDSQLTLTMLYDSLNHVINAFSPQAAGGMVQEKGSRESCSSWTVLHAQCTSALTSGFPISQGNAEALAR